MDTSERGKRINKVLDDLNLARDKIGERIVIHKIRDKRSSKGDREGNNKKSKDR